jgi:NAD(P)-dependent dehydrogenase (short-subunit alcohol dehydrogenase family)
MISPETERVLAPTIPMRGLGPPQEVAQVVFLLRSNSASYVTGEEIQINGGQHVWGSGRENDASMKLQRNFP